MKRMIAVLMSVLLLIAPLSGCSNKKTTIAVTNYPLQYLVERIGNGTVQAECISDGYYMQRSTLKNDAMETLKKSQSLLYIGELEPYFDVFYEDIKDTGVNFLNVGSVNSVYRFARYTKDSETNTFVETPYYEGDIFEGYATYKKDPMIWMDPIMMTSLAFTVSEYLSDTFPENKALYEEQYRQIELELAQLGANYQEEFQQTNNVRFASLSPDFGNWQKSYGFEVYPIMLSKYGARPTDEQLLTIKATLVENGVRYMVMQEGLPEDLALLQDEIMNQLGLQPIALRSITLLTQSDIDNKKDYFTLMYDNFNILSSISE